jgi:PAS domain S-box-containing protein
VTREAQLGWPPGRDEMAGHIRSYDWAATPLGPVEGWPQSLRTAVGIMLGASSPLAVFWGEELVLLYNDAWRALLGRKHPSALGRPAREVFPETWDTLGPMFSAVLAGHGSVGASEQPLLLNRGGRLEVAWLDCSANPIPREDGSVGGVFHIIASDAVRWRRAEAALRKSEAHHRMLFDSIDEGFCLIEVLFDAEGRPHDYRFLEVNPAFERQTGLVGAVGRTMRQLAPDHETHWFDTYGRIARSGVPERFEQRAQALGRHFDVYAFRIGEPHERKVAILFNDVTRRKQTEQELRQRAEFEQQLIGIVSHDLRQPLQAITFSASALLRRQDLSEGVRGAAGRILAGTDRMGRMLMDLLDFTQARLGGGIPLQRAPLNLGALAERVADEARLLYPERDIDVGVHGDVEGAWDEDRLSQVLTNLVSNAFAYSPEDTPVGVEVRGEGPDVLIRVHNAGPPIPPELLPRLFEPMKRGLSQARNPRRSIGLGLFIVKHMVEAHGGHLEVRSTAEEGTTFTVRVPRTTA